MAVDYENPPRAPRIRARPLRIEGDVAYVIMTRGLEAMVDVADAHLVGDRNWRAKQHKGLSYAFAYGPRVGKHQPMILMHRLILAAPPGTHVDHINHNTLDNRRSNLRLATAAQNCWNTGSWRTNTSGHKGVWRDPKSHKWTSAITVNGERHYLGVFATAEDAADAYKQAAVRMRGEFHPTHFRELKGPGQ